MSVLQHSEELLASYSATRAPRGPMLVASDTSPASDAAFPMARALAAHTGATVQVISALRPNALPTYAFDAVPYPVVPTAEMLEGREGMVKAQMARIVPSATPWAVTVRTGDPVHEIVAHASAQEARLIIVGRGKHGMVERLLGGESVLRLLQLGDTPVLAVDAALETLPRRIVIATDFSAFSVYAAQIALDLVAKDADVQLVHVAPALSDTGPVLRKFASEYRQAATKSFATLIERLQRPGLRFTSVLLEGNASARLIDHLTDVGADLVVTATHGYGFLRRMMLGSVTAELVRSASCSVLCVPGTARTMAAARAQAMSVPLNTRTLDMTQLDHELFNFSVRHSARRCTIEVQQQDFGAQTIGHHLPLVGVTHDAPRATISVMFGASTLEGAHLTHGIPGCRGVDILSDASGREQVLRIAHDGGQTLVLLEPV